MGDIGNEIGLFYNVSRLLISTYKDLKIDDVEVNKPSLAELLVRIDKRRDYFVIFYDDTDKLLFYDQITKMEEIEKEDYMDSALDQFSNS